MIFVVNVLTKSLPMKKFIFLSIFVSFCVANGLLRRKIAGDIRSYLAMIFVQGVIQLILSIIMTKEYVFFSKKILFLVVCSYIGQIINWKSNQNLKSITLSMIEPSRVFFVTILALIWINKRYSKLQYFSVLLIMLGIGVSSIMRTQSNQKDHSLYLCLAIFSCFTNALSAVGFYKFFSGKRISFWSYIFTFSVYSTFLYTCGLVYELFFTNNFDSSLFFQNKLIYCMHITTSLEFLGYRFLGFHTCPVEKNLVLIIINISIPIFYNILFNFEFTKSSIIGLVLVYFGTFTFELPNIIKKIKQKRISQQIRFETETIPD